MSVVNKWVWLAIPGALGVAVVAGAVIAKDAADAEKAAAPPPAASQAQASPGAAQPNPITANRANQMIGAAVIASGGETVGQVQSYGPGANSKALAYTVRVTADIAPDGKTVQIPEDRAVVNGAAVQLMISKDDVKKLL